MRTSRSGPSRSRGSSMTVSVRSPGPAVTEPGIKSVTAGTGFATMFVTVSVAGVETPPPGALLNTVMSAEPVVATSAAGIAAPNSPDETNVVERSDPFQRIVEIPFTKSEPLTVSVKSVEPAVTKDGARVTILGTGFTGPGFADVGVSRKARAWFPGR